MSKGCPDNLSVNVVDIRDYVHNFLGKINGVIEVRLWGSRSPMKAKQHRANSDWDLLLICENHVLIPDPKLRSVGIYVDVASVSKKHWDSFKDKNTTSVQIYPVDEYGVLNDY